MCQETRRAYPITFPEVLLEVTGTVNARSSFFSFLLKGVASKTLVSKKDLQIRKQKYQEKERWLHKSYTDILECTV